jgi:hypothetical protein
MLNKPEAFRKQDTGLEKRAWGAKKKANKATKVFVLLASSFLQPSTF